MLQEMVRCVSLVSTLPEPALRLQHVRAFPCLGKAGGGRAVQIATASPMGNRMEAGDTVELLGFYCDLGNWYPFSSWFSEQAYGSWKRRDQIRPRERKKKNKKIGKARTFLEALWPLSLQPPERRRRRETKQKAQEKNEPKQHQHEGCVVQSKQRRDATGQAPSQKPASFRRTRGSCRKRWPFMARRGGPWRGSLPY